MTRPLAIWARRLAVLAAYTTMFAVLAAAMPILLPVAAAADLVRGRSWTVTRTVVFFQWYLACELVGVAAAFLLWLAGGPWTGASRERYLSWNFALQRQWARALARGAFRIFGIRLVVDDGGYRFGHRPVLVFVRHASTADTILAALLVSVPYGTRLRYVLKRELLWDPCLDIVGNRLPNVFVVRGSADTEREVARVGELGRALGPDDGVLIYPEGTRFSRSKKKRIVEKLREQGREADAREAEALRHVLRPHFGGVAALLDAAPEADVVFVAHTGFEGSASFDRFFNGGLDDRTVHANLRVVPAASVPRTPEGRRAWLMDEWRRIDAFVDAHAQAPAAAPQGPPTGSGSGA